MANQRRQTGGGRGRRFSGTVSRPRVDRRRPQGTRRRCRVLIVALLLATIVDAASAQGGLRGWLAERDGRVLESENADRRFTPASVQKLLLAAALLHRLGPEHRIVTRMRAAGTVEGATLHGDLVLEAAGDPSWSDEFFEKEPRRPLRELARALADSGIEWVNGDLVIDLRAFPGRAYPSSRALSELGLGMAAPTSGLALERNVVELRIAPGGRVGDPGRLEAVEGLDLVNRMVTVSAARNGRGTVELLPVQGTDTVIVHGEYPIGEPPFDVRVSVPSPEAHAARALREELSLAGIVIGGGIRLLESPAPAPPPGPELVAFASPPLAELLAPVLEDSDNWLAEMLLRVLGRTATDEGRIDHGLDELERFLVEEVGVDVRDLELDDGSGLSPFNLVTPRAVVATLRFAWQQPWRDPLLAAMARNGEGTLRYWPGLPPLVAKTGTLSHTLALAGVVDPRGARPIFFAWVVNHDAADRGRLRQEVAARLRAVAAASE